MIRVVVVDDHLAFRQGLRAVLGEREEVTVVEDFGDAESAIARLGELRPQVVLMDLSLPGLGGLEATALIVRDYPEIAVLVLSMLDDRPNVLAAIEGGARGYLVKSSGIDDIVRGIQAVVSGQLLLGGDISEHLTSRSLHRDDGFTARERQVLEMLAKAATTGEIAARLGISGKTVRNYLSTLYFKLGVEDRGQAVLAARKSLET